MAERDRLSLEVEIASQSGEYQARNLVTNEFLESNRIFMTRTGGGC